MSFFGAHLRCVCAISLSLLVASTSRSTRADGRDYHEEVVARGPPTGLTIPLQLGHAAAWVPERTGPVYKLGLSVLPGVRILDLFQLHVALEGFYRNPGWDAGTGLRVTGLLWRAQGGLVPVHAVAEGTYLWRGGGLRALGGLMLGLGTLASVNFLFGRETDRHEYVANIGIAVDILGFWDPAAAIMHYVNHEDVLHELH
jgi:hypothetical protein